MISLQIRTTGGARAAGLSLALALLSACASMGQIASSPRTAAEDAVVQGPMRSLDVTPAEFLRDAEGIYVVVNLDDNRLRLMDGRTILWEAPVGTGTGLRLQSDTNEWHFTTPRGVFQIQFKEELPVWILPEWYFVKRGEPVPPVTSPARRAPGQLGVAAVYLGEEIAIHGTDRPELLGSRVSHGCIRLDNRHAQRLFHNVQVGTPVVIFGGEHLDAEPAPNPTDPGRPTVTRPDALAGLSSADILKRLGRELERADTTTNWIPYASRLITRGLKEDADALRGLLELAGTARTPRLNREYATFLADAYSRGALRTVVSLARIDQEKREQAAAAIVSATLAQYVGPLNTSSPWPTRRVSQAQLGPEARRGMQALREAEDAYMRQRTMTAERGR
ncbi:hypothetical protein BH23GEM6_BH23GEM6_04200 [soil metagenome]